MCELGAPVPVLSSGPATFDSLASRLLVLTGIADFRSQAARALVHPVISGIGTGGPLLHTCQRLRTCLPVRVAQAPRCAKSGFGSALDGLES